MTADLARNPPRPPAPAARWTAPVASVKRRTASPEDLRSAFAIDGLTGLRLVRGSSVLSMDELTLRPIARLVRLAARGSVQ